jgi:hypothetical protein
MAIDANAESDDGQQILFEWTARKMQPVVLLYVAAVFVVFMAVAILVFDSINAIKALALTAVAAIVPLVPSVLARVDYRLRGGLLEQRPHDDSEPKDFETIARLDELSHIKPLRHGFKYFRPLDERNLLVRFWKLEFSDQYSGEVHVEPDDQEKVMELMRRHGVAVR